MPSGRTYGELYDNLEEGIIITDLAVIFHLQIMDLWKERQNRWINHPHDLAGNFFEVHHDIEEVGSDLEFSPMGGSGYFGSPSLKVEGGSSYF